MGYRYREIRIIGDQNDLGAFNMRFKLPWDVGVADFEGCSFISNLSYACYSRTNVNHLNFKVLEHWTCL